MVFARSIGLAGFNLEVRRLNTPTWSQSAKIAAGAKESNEHIAEVRLTVSPVLPGIKVPFVPRLRFGNGKGGKHAKFTPANGPQTGVDAGGEPVYGPLVTNANGQVVIGTIRSSDTLRDIQVQLPVDLGDNAVKSTLNQAWNEGDEWTFEPAHLKGDIPISFKPHFLSNGVNVPITYHTMRFFVSKVRIERWDIPTRTMKAAIITDNPDLVDANASPPVVLGTPGSYAHLVRPGLLDNNLPPDHIPDSGNGTYQGILRLPVFPTPVVVQQVWFKADDVTVYKKPVAP